MTSRIYYFPGKPAIENYLTNIQALTKDPKNNAIVQRIATAFAYKRYHDIGIETNVKKLVDPKLQHIIIQALQNCALTSAIEARL